MADEDDKQDKTEDATPRKRQEAREQGQVALSTEVTSAAMLCAGLGVIVTGGGMLARACAAMVESSLVDLGDAGRATLDPMTTSALLGGSARTVGFAALAIVVPM